MRPTLLAALAAALIATGAAASGAHHGKEAEHAAEQVAQRAGDLVIETAWARRPLGANGAAYVTVRTEGAEPDRLVGVATDVAGRAELHTHVMEDGVMRMRPLDALEINPGEPAVMRPGGTHVMLMGMKRELSEGERFAVTLRFERAGEVEVMVRVMAPGASGPGSDTDGGHMDHDGDMDHEHDGGGHSH